MKAAGTVYADPYDGEYAFCQKLFQRFSGDAVCALPYGCDVQGVFQRLPLDIAFIIIHCSLDKNIFKAPGSILSAAPVIVSGVIPSYCSAAARQVVRQPEDFMV